MALLPALWPARPRSPAARLCPRLRPARRAVLTRRLRGIRGVPARPPAQRRDLGPQRLDQRGLLRHHRPQFRVPGSQSSYDSCSGSGTPEPNQITKRTPAPTRRRSTGGLTGYLPGTSLLEIGPGTGHLLAAAHKAGRSVTAVESSEVHRTFIRKTWGIHSLYPDIAAVPHGVSFDAVVAINVLEHVYDIAGFLRSIAEVLAPHGVLFVSTVNAVSLEAVLLRSWWSMCKVHDHVSFPSPGGMARAAQATGLRAERVWSTELPFELPVSALVAARDWARTRRSPSIAASDGHLAGSPAESFDTASKARLARFYSVGGPIRSDITAARGVGTGRDCQSSFASE